MPHPNPTRRATLTGGAAVALTALGTTLAGTAAASPTTSPTTSPAASTTTSPTGAVPDPGLDVSHATPEAVALVTSAFRDKTARDVDPALTTLLAPTIES